MKKLIILAAVAMVAAVSQASKVNWSAPGLVDSAGVDIIDSTKGISVAYTIWASDGATVLVDGAAGDISPTTGYAQGSWSGAQTQTQYWIQAILTDSTGATLTSEKASFTTSGSATFKPNLTSGANMDVSGSKFVNTGANYGWQTVPEPTSGLLLLLGVAGLALRRRRA